MSVTEDCIRAINSGEYEVADLVNVIYRLEIENHIKQGMLEYMQNEVAKSEAKAQKAEDTLYAFTHAGWKIDAMNRKREEEKLAKRSSKNSEK